MRKETATGTWISSISHDWHGPISASESGFKCARCGQIAEDLSKAEKCILHWEGIGSGYKESE